MIHGVGSLIFLIPTNSLIHTAKVLNRVDPEHRDQPE